MKRRVFTWSACGLMLVFLAACGADQDGGTAAAPQVTASETEVNACDIVTQEDASALFEQPASPQAGHSAVTMIGQCLWTWDTETSNQLLQFHIWDPRGYDVPADAESLDLGEGGYIRKHPVAGVDIAWLQDNRLISLAYSTIGPDAPKAPERAEQMIALARLVESRL